ncbi:Transmembrane protein 97 [Porphyridium purpureum]|uniref:Transmembrane protein 97 n=1 Tax=Porphyridium purpureum TaxID=35688 RepID=A0A5J4YKH7_PORPP|nr:Transmembrane protein 97 [Porphyridium purpureum]|eukprot:POR0489..scf244_11
MEGGVIDWFFAIFWASFGLVAVLVDPCGLALGVWPPPQICDVMVRYAERLDPVYASKPLWLKVCIAAELALYPAFCVAACVALRRGISKSQWLKLPAVVVTTIILQSYTQIIAHNFFDTASPTSAFVVVPPRPMLWIALYFPYILIPCLFVARVFAARHPKLD